MEPPPPSSRPSPLALHAIIRVLMGDHHHTLREAVKRALCAPAFGLPEIDVVADALTGPQVLAAVAALKGRAGLDVVLLDIALPDQDGLEVLQTLRGAWPALPVLMLSTYPEKQYAVRCIQLGAAGVLHKQADAAEMVRAVRKVAAGGLYVTTATAEALAAAMDPAMRQGAEALSQREQQVLQLLAAGHSVSEIGAQLGIAPNTVSTYRARILEKTGTQNDAELALYAERHARLARGA